MSLFFQVKSTVKLHNVFGSIDTLEFKPLFVRKDFNTNKIIEDKLCKFEVIGKGLVINTFNIHKNVQSLKISNVSISTTTLGDLYQPQDSDQILHTIEFDLRSEITDQSIARSTFMRLRLLAKQLDDRIQAHIFYVKELELYAKDRNIRRDDRWLISINRLLNENGISFIKPISLLVVVNLIILPLIFYVECTYSVDNFDFRHIVLPTHSILTIDQTYSGVTYALDAIRRILNSILIFSAISAALRFRFKG